MDERIRERARRLAIVGVAALAVVATAATSPAPPPPLPSPATGDRARAATVLPAGDVSRIVHMTIAPADGTAATGGTASMIVAFDPPRWFDSTTEPGALMCGDGATVTDLVGRYQGDAVRIDAPLSTGQPISCRFTPAKGLLESVDVDVAVEAWVESPPAVPLEIDLAPESAAGLDAGEARAVGVADALAAAAGSGAVVPLGTLQAIVGSPAQCPDGGAAMSVDEVVGRTITVRVFGEPGDPCASAAAAAAFDKAASPSGATPETLRGDARWFTLFPGRIIGDTPPITLSVTACGPALVLYDETTEGPDATAGGQPAGTGDEAARQARAIETIRPHVLAILDVLATQGIDCGQGG